MLKNINEKLGLVNLYKYYILDIKNNFSSLADTPEKIDNIMDHMYYLRDELNEYEFNLIVDKIYHKSWDYPEGFSFFKDEINKIYVFLCDREEILSGVKDKNNIRLVLM